MEPYDHVSAALKAADLLQRNRETALSIEHDLLIDVVNALDDLLSAVHFLRNGEELRRALGSAEIIAQALEDRVRGESEDLKDHFQYGRHGWGCGCSSCARTRDLAGVQG